MTVYALEGVNPELPQRGRYWVAPSASVIGKVRLGKDASIWFGAVLRGDNEMIDVGARTNIQDNSMLHTDMGFPMSIGEDCTIGHLAILHGCTLGPRCLVGMSATVMNGVVIGEESLVGAGALIPEGKEIPAGSLVLGSPGKVVRQLSEEERARLRFTAAHYIEQWARFSGGLSVVE